jgi:hypothetical protein
MVSSSRVLSANDTSDAADGVGELRLMASLEAAEPLVVEDVLLGLDMILEGCSHNKVLKLFLIKIGNRSH